jgi:hypothetical protein
VAEHSTIPVSNLAADGTSLYLGGGNQIVAYDRATGNLTKTWNVGQAVQLMAASAGRLWAVVGSASSGQVVEINPGGSGVTTSGPGAIQVVSVVGNQVLLIHNAWQGLDSSSQTYDASGLAGPLANAPGTANANHAISSLAGPVDLGFPGSLPCQGHTPDQQIYCVGRYNLSTGAVTDTVMYPQGTQVGLLLGPYPATIVLPSSGPVYLDRIG